MGDTHCLRKSPEALIGARMTNPNNNNSPYGSDSLGQEILSGENLNYYNTEPVDLDKTLGSAAVDACINQRNNYVLLPDTYVKYDNPVTYEVEIKSDLTLADYEKITPAEDMETLKNYAEKMRGKELMFVNATSAGGGVAIMRAPLVHLLNQLGVETHWYALRAEPGEWDEFSRVTKGKFHNVLQNVAKPEVELNDQDKAVYSDVIGKNAEVLKEPLSTADVIIIDDWQPSGLIPYIRGDQRRQGFNPDAKILFRDHIQTEGDLMETPGTPQHTTWNYIWNENRVCDSDAFITHPMHEFVPPNVPDEKVVFMPATAELLDDLNRDLTIEEWYEGIDFINDQLAQNESQKPIDLNRPYIVLIARFDPSKGMPQGMKSYAKAREKMMAKGMPEENLPQFVIVGNGSVDDPDGVPLLEEMMELRRNEYDNIKDDIKVARVPHNDKAINALLKGSSLALQPSTKEGFESRVSDALFQGVPVIGSDRGGIPLQIVHGESGHVVDPHDTDTWAEIIADTLTDPAKYNQLLEGVAKHAVEHNKKNFTTVSNAIRWLGLSAKVLRDPNFAGNRRWAEDIAAD